jgi:hypothetical protein
LQYASTADAQACVWDLCVMSFERQAWLETVLLNPAGVDLETYFMRRLNDDI